MARAYFDGACVIDNKATGADISEFSAVPNADSILFFFVHF